MVRSGHLLCGVLGAWSLVLYACVSFKTNAVKSSINDNLQLPSVFHFSPLGQHLLGFCRGKPRGMASRFVTFSDVFHLKKERLGNILLYTSRLPSPSSRVDIPVEVPGFNPSCHAGLFQCLALGGQAVRQTADGISFGKSPPATAIGIDQQEFR